MKRANGLLNFVTVFLLTLSPQHNGSEVNSTENSEGSAQSINYVESEFSSPLVVSEDAHATLYTTTFDSQHFAYPVKIISIDSWLLSEQTFDTELLLKPGKHQIVLEPDFSNIITRKNFMNGSWETKIVEIDLKEGQHIALSARLDATGLKSVPSIKSEQSKEIFGENIKDWKPEFYLIQKDIKISNVD